MRPVPARTRTKPAPCHVHAFSDSLRLARQLGKALACEVTPIRVHHFPDGESLVRAPSLTGGTAIVVRS